MQNKPATSGLFRNRLFNQIMLFFLANLKLFFLLSTWIIFHFSLIFLSWSLQLPSSKPHSTIYSPGKCCGFSLWIPALAKFYLIWVPRSLSQLWRHHIKLVTASSALKSSASHSCSFVQMTFLIITWTAQNPTCFHLSPHLMYLSVWRLAEIIIM